MRLVLGAGLVVQHLQAFTVEQWPADQACNALLDAVYQLRLATAEKHAIAGAVGIDSLAAGLGFNGQRARHAGSGCGNEAIAFLVAQETTEHHHPRAGQRGQDTDLSVNQIDQAGGT